MEIYPDQSVQAMTYARTNQNPQERLLGDLLAPGISTYSKGVFPQH